MRLFVSAVGVVAPGMEGWEQAREVLSGRAVWQSQPLGAFKPALLPANERRRTTHLIKLALHTAEDALRDYDGRAAELASVFASSEGDAEIADRICRALLLPDRPVSPTQFHNSVHNAAAGYWAIASGSQRFSTSIAAGPATFAHGLLEAASVAVLEQQDVMLLAYDFPLPPPLYGRGLAREPFGVALILSPHAGPRCRSQLTLSLASGAAPAHTAEMPWHELVDANPAAASLPLLSLLAANEQGQLHLPCSDRQSVVVEVVPC